MACFIVVLNNEILCIVVYSKDLFDVSNTTAIDAHICFNKFQKVGTSICDDELCIVK